MGIFIKGIAIQEQYSDYNNFSNSWIASNADKEGYEKIVKEYSRKINRLILDDHKKIEAKEIQDNWNKLLKTSKELIK